MMGGMGGMMGFPGGMMQSAEEEWYDLNCDVLMTVTEQDVMTLSISLDQQDIGKVELGQKAQVKVNPLKGRTFEAEVTKIDLFGTSSGGSSKFAVELTMPMQEQMLPGMSAVAYIPLYTKTDVLKNIDLAQIMALAEQGVLGKLVEVESADGDIVEVVVE